MANTIDLIRKFNRDYLNKLKIFNSKFNNDFSLTETRILFEISIRPKITLKEICEILHIDTGYTSRIIKRLTSKGYLIKLQDKKDKRSNYLKITNLGSIAIEEINKTENQRIQSLLNTMDEPQQKKFAQIINQAHNLLNPQTPSVPIIRTHKPGDLGIITHFHGKYYADTYGYSEIFEAHVAAEFSEFIFNFDPSKDIFYVVEQNGEIKGSLALQHRSDSSAQARFFYLSPSLRGFGIGKTLMTNMMEFAKKTSYEHIFLWTHQDLGTAHHIYKKFGFKCTKTKTHSLWKKNLEEQMWEVNLKE